MVPPGRLRSLLLAAATTTLVALGATAGGGAVAQTTPGDPTTPPTPTTPAATTPGPVVELPAFGDISYRRLAQLRGLQIPLKTSEAALIRVELVIPRSIARKLKVRVGRGQVRAVLAKQTVTAEGAGYVVAYPKFGRKVANRLKAKKRHFKLTVRAIAGQNVVSGVITVKTRD